MVSRYPQIPSSDIFSSYVTGTPSADRFVSKVLTNIRDVKRFVNFFSLSIRLVASEVIFSQYFYISLLRFKFQSLINSIRENKQKYINEVLNPFQHQTINDGALADAFKEFNVSESDQLIIKEILSEVYKTPSKAPDRRSI